jgi:hypothetical protein
MRKLYPLAAFSEGANATLRKSAAVSAARRESSNKPAATTSTSSTLSPRRFDRRQHPRIYQAVLPQNSKNADNEPESSNVRVRTLEHFGWHVLERRCSRFRQKLAWWDACYPPSRSALASTVWRIGAIAAAWAVSISIPIVLRLEVARRSHARANLLCAPAQASGLE